MCPGSRSGKENVSPALWQPKPPTSIFFYSSSWPKPSPNNVYCRWEVGESEGLVFYWWQEAQEHFLYHTSISKVICYVLFKCKSSGVLVKLSWDYGNMFILKEPSIINISTLTSAQMHMWKEPLRAANLWINNPNLAGPSALWSDGTFFTSTNPYQMQQAAFAMKTFLLVLQTHKSGCLWYAFRRVASLTSYGFMCPSLVTVG